MAGYPRAIDGLATDIGIALTAFAVTALLAGLLGAANLGTALGIGQVGFILATVFVLLRR